MKLRVEESYDGEFDALDTDEFAQKLEQAFDGARQACSVSKGSEVPSNDGAVAVIKDLAEVMTLHYRKRLKQLRKEIVSAVKDSA